MFIWLGLFASSAIASALPEPCRLHLTQLRPFIATELYANDVRTSDDEEVDWLPGTLRYGSKGVLRILRSRRGLWHSDLRDPDEYNLLLGNPQTLPAIVGPKVAWIFGFRKIDDLTMTVPDAEALNHGIRLLNKKLKLMGYPQIRWRFYQTEGSDADADFISNFVKFQKPLARTGAVALNDLSYHTSEILLPDEFSKGLQTQIRWALEGERFGRSLSPNSHQSHQLERLIFTSAKRLDLLGNLAHYLAPRSAARTKEQREKALDVMLIEATHINLGLAEFLQDDLKDPDLVTQIQHHLIMNSLRPVNFSPPYRFGDGAKLLLQVEERVQQLQQAAALFER